MSSCRCGGSTAGVFTETRLMGGIGGTFRGEPTGGLVGQVLSGRPATSLFHIAGGDFRARDGVDGGVTTLADGCRQGYGHSLLPLRLEDPVEIRVRGCGWHDGLAVVGGSTLAWRTTESPRIIVCSTCWRLCVESNVTTFPGMWLEFSGRAFLHLLGLNIFIFSNHGVLVESPSSATDFD